MVRCVGNALLCLLQIEMHDDGFSMSISMMLEFEVVLYK